VSPEEKRLDAIARRVVPSWWEVKTIRDELGVGGLVVYTVETTDSKGVSRWFAIPAKALRPEVADHVIESALAKAVNSN